MQLNSIKTTLIAVWILAVCTAGIAFGAASLPSWIAIAALAVFPPLVMMWRWNDPRQTMSEAIQEARR